jgi:hypothetical protein
MQARLAQMEEEKNAVGPYPLWMYIPIALTRPAHRK